MGRLKRLAKELGIDRDTEFTGYIEKRYDVVKLLKSTHLFCLPSVVEGFGIVVIEAAASGIPFVVSDIEPLVEVTRNGKGGLIFKQRDADDLADKIVKLLTDARLYESKKKEAKVLAGFYDWSDIASKVKSVYSEVVNE